MSGFEAVGVVLGAIPLLISGLEHYAEGIRTIKTMWNYEAVVNHLVVEFRLSQSIFRHSCEDLLMPILSDAEAAGLLEGRSPDWNDPRLDKRLHERLGPDYEVYTRCVWKLRSRLEFFSRKLGLAQGTMLPPWMLNTGINKGLRDKFFRETWRRIKGGFDTSAVNRILAEIQSSVNQLAQFTKGSAAFAPKRAALQNRKNSRNRLKFKDHARRLFKTLGSHWLCSCIYPHRASLRLDINQMLLSHEEKEVRFNILFSNDTIATTTAPTSIPWNWLQVDVQLLPNTSSQLVTLAIENSKILQSARTTTVVPSQRKGTRHVSFNLQDPLKSSAAIYSASAPRPSSSPVSRIHDLCGVLSQGPQSSSCVGYLDDHEFQQHLFMSADDMDADEDQEILCFHDILRLKAAYGLGVKEKYMLALTVASAVLHLQATPWLEERWCLNDIHFMRGKKALTLIDQAYVTKSFSPPNGSQDLSDSKDQYSHQARVFIANETIFALGVALIEISFGVPILSLQEKSDLALPDIPGLTEFSIATRLVNEGVIKDRDHDEYAEVVFRCVKGVLSTGASRLNFEDAKVQQSFYEDVVLPLQRLNQMLHNENDVGIT